MAPPSIRGTIEVLKDVVLSVTSILKAQLVNGKDANVLLKSLFSK